MLHVLGHIIRCQWSSPLSALCSPLPHPRCIIIVPCRAQPAISTARQLLYSLWPERCARRRRSHTTYARPFRGLNYTPKRRGLLNSRSLTLDASYRRYLLPVHMKKCPAVLRTLREDYALHPRLTVTGLQWSCCTTGVVQYIPFWTPPQGPLEWYRSSQTIRAGSTPNSPVTMNG